LRRGKSLTVGQLADMAPQGFADLEKYVASLKPKTSKKSKEPAAAPTLEEVLKKKLEVAAIKGRAPFTRERMRLVYDWVMTHLEHPAETGGPLYRGEEIRQALLKRDIDEQTNNHLVRHRLRILDRLHRDLVKQFANDEPDKVDRCIIEVASDLRSFSGKTNKEIEMDLGQRLSNFKHVVKKLEKDLEGTRFASRISAGLIRKARIAEDLGWKCPYTGISFDAQQLADGSVFDKDHIIPYSQRPSNSLDSLVITFKEINKWKGNRTAAQFMQECSGQPVPHMKNVELFNFNQFKKHVESLEQFKGHDDDKKRKKNRKHLLLLERWEEKEFLPKDLTQTSQLVRLGAQMLTQFYPPNQVPVIISLPGSVTGKVRTGWDLVGCLEAACPAVIGEDGQTLPKGEIRKLTHLHHALDACVLAMADAYFPRDGSIWELMVKRNLSAEQLEKLTIATNGQYRAGTNGRAELQDLPKELKANLREKLAERRVVQHVPADMSGLKADQTVWRVLDPKDTHPSAQKLLKLIAKRNQTVSAKDQIKVPDPDDPTEDQAMIICWKRKDAPATKPSKCLHETNGRTVKKGDAPSERPSNGFWVQYDIVAKSKLFGLVPKPNTPGKLKAQKAVKVVSENFGVAIIGGDGVIIRGYNVPAQLAALKKQNGGVKPMVLRNGMVISVRTGRYLGTWRVRSIKEVAKMGLVVDFSDPDGITLVKVNVLLRTLIQGGLRFHPGVLVES
jgi:hypothetical protein